MSEILTADEIRALPAFTQIVDSLAHGGHIGDEEDEVCDLCKFEAIAFARAVATAQEAKRQPPTTGASK